MIGVSVGVNHRGINSQYFRTCSKSSGQELVAISDFLPTGQGLYPFVVFLNLTYSPTRDRKVRITIIGLISHRPATFQESSDSWAPSRQIRLPFLRRTRYQSLCL
jgi:hypothetical protein